MAYLVISKTIDTTYKRFEIYTNESISTIEIETLGVESISPIKTLNGQTYVYVDLKYDPNNPLMQITLKDGSKIIETASFNINDMMWV